MQLQSPVHGESPAGALLLTCKRIPGVHVTLVTVQVQNLHMLWRAHIRWVGGRPAKHIIYGTFTCYSSVADNPHLVALYCPRGMVVSCRVLQTCLQVEGIAVQGTV